MTNDQRGRAVVTRGCRTPFIRAGGDLADLDVRDLGRIVVREALERAEVDSASVDELIFGNVSRPLRYHNLGREVALAAGLPASLPAYTVGEACASGCQAITNGADLIDRGYAEVVVAAGAESLSNVPLEISRPLARALTQAQRQKSIKGRVNSLLGLRPRDLPPVAPAIAETSTGLTMGQSAEIMAQKNGIPRQAQDEFALRSHQRAARDADSGWLADDLVATQARSRTITADGHIRRDTSLEKLAQLSPVFDPLDGTITAGNSSPLTDGAAALVLMSEARARSLGFEDLVSIRSYAYAAVDPSDQLLLAPAYAIPRALERAGIAMADVEVVEMHEAFAAQVLSTLKALASDEFARDKLGLRKRVGAIHPDRLNISGGSIALGHPFGATGIRIVLTLARQMQRRQARYGLGSVCAAGGLGCAIVLERLEA